LKLFLIHPPGFFNGRSRGFRFQLTIIYHFFVGSSQSIEGSWAFQKISFGGLVKLFVYCLFVCFHTVDV
jgi:hypothetical protein